MSAVGHDTTPADSGSSAASSAGCGLLRGADHRQDHHVLNITISRAADSVSGSGGAHLKSRPDGFPVLTGTAAGVDQLTRRARPGIGQELAFTGGSQTARLATRTLLSPHPTGSVWMWMWPGIRLVAPRKRATQVSTGYGQDLFLVVGDQTAAYERPTTGPDCRRLTVSVSPGQGRLTTGDIPGRNAYRHDHLGIDPEGVPACAAMTRSSRCSMSSSPAS